MSPASVSLAVRCSAVPGAASRVPAVEAGLALSPALAWAPDLHPVRCKEVQGLRVSADSAPLGRGMAGPASWAFLPSSLATRFGGQGCGCQAGLPGFGPQHVSWTHGVPSASAPSPVWWGRLRNPQATRLTRIPFPSACVGSGAGARAGTGWLPCAVVGHAAKDCRVGKRRGRLGSDPAPSPSSAVTLGKLLGLSVPQCHLFSGDDNSDVSLRLLSLS